jgi:hypothetical protein
MEITQQVREYAAKLNETPEMAVEAGMEEMAGKFREMGLSTLMRKTRETARQDWNSC